MFPASRGSRTFRHVTPFGSLRKEFERTNKRQKCEMKKRQNNKKAVTKSDFGFRGPEVFRGLLTICIVIGDKADVFPRLYISV